MIALLDMIPGKYWLYAGLAVLLGFLWLRHDSELRAQGAAHEKAAIATQVADDTKETDARIAVAEHSHDQELTDLSAYRASHPDVVRLCVPAPTVRTPSAAQRSPSPAAGPVQPVPAGDSGSGAGQAGPDIFPMLDALAGRADEVSAQLRARQSIEK